VKVFSRIGDSEESMAAPVRFRLGFISVLASVVGVIAGFSAFVLFKLIGLIINIAFYCV
jgi:hypothetical protein